MKKKFFSVLLFITLLIILFSCLDVQFENDTFYSIKIGQSILNNGIDMIDHYSWIPNLSYTYPHWLFDLIVGIVYNFFSFSGIYWLTFILYFILGICLYFCYKKLGYNQLLSYIIMISVLVLIRDFISCRAQLISYILIVLFYFNLICLIKTNEKKYVLFMGILSLLLVNCHVAVWPFLLLLFLPYFAEKMFEFLIQKRKLKFSLSVKKYNIKLLIVAFLVVLLTGFMTPLGLVPFTYLVKTISGVSQLYIAEHQPILFWNYKLLIIYIFCLICILRNKKIDMHDIFLLLGLSIMMLSSIRHQTLFIILSSYVFIKYIDVEKLKKIKFRKYKYFYDVISVVSIVMLIWYPLIYINIDKLNEEYISDNYPKNAVMYIKNNLDYKNMKIFNEYNYGSYLLLNDIKVMFDSRADLYTKEFNGKYEYFEEFMNIGKNYKEIFSKYDIDYALVYKDSQIDLYLSFDDDYKEIYDDDSFVIYIDIEEKDNKL